MTSVAEPTRRRRVGVPGAPEAAQEVDPDTRPMDVTTSDDSDFEIDLVGSGGGLIDAGNYQIQVKSIEFVPAGDGKNPRFPVRVRIKDGLAAGRVLSTTLTVNPNPSDNWYLMNFIQATGAFTPEELAAFNSGTTKITKKAVLESGQNAEMWATVVKSSDKKFKNGVETNKIKTFFPIGAF